MDGRWDLSTYLPNRKIEIFPPPGPVSPSATTHYPLPPTQSESRCESRCESWNGAGGGRLGFLFFFHFLILLKEEFVGGGRGGGY